MVSSLKGDVNTLPMEQYFMHKISKCYDKSGSQIFGFGKYGPCKKLSCEIWWCNMLVFITFFQTMSYLRKHSCCICVSSNRCIVISHFEYYSVYIKRYVFSIRNIRNMIVTTCIIELQFNHLTATTVWLSLHGKILFTCRL